MASDSIVDAIVRSGKYFRPWKDLQPVIAERVGATLDAANAKYPDLSADAATGQAMFAEQRKQALEGLASFDSAPFTLQRICELVVDYESQYKSCKKLMNAMLKLVSVCSTIAPSDPTAAAAAPSPSAMDIDGQQ
jgi:serine/threonine-protein phosphatase 4 regulatory subunit 2